MLPFGVTDVEFALATFVSALVGISLVVAASKFVKLRYLAAFAVGVYLWFFPDTLGGANYLDVNGGFVLSSYVVSLVALFVVGLVVFFAFDKKMFTSGESIGYGGLVAGALAALALGLHGMAEGADFGFTAAQTPSNTLLGAFGGIAPSASWALHKMLEPTIAAVSYVAVAGTAAKKPSERLLDSVVLATIFVLPPVIGSIAGYYVAFDITYIYALGLGASVYAIARAARPLYSPEGADPWVSVKIALFAALGFILIFISAMLHS